MKLLPIYIAIGLIVAGLFLMTHPAHAMAAVTFPVNGGTGTSTKPAYGQVLVGDGTGLYNLVATSTLGFLSNITGLVTAGTSITLTGSGTSASPYNINTFPYLFPSNATTTVLNFSSGLTAGNSVTLSGITGSTQCLHVNTSGVVSGTGSDCGSGGGGTPGGASSTIQYNKNGVFGGIFDIFTDGTRLGIATSAPFYPLDVAGIINTDKYSGYYQDRNLILYASSTNSSSAIGIGAGPNISTNSSLMNDVAIGAGAMSNLSLTGNLNTAVGSQSLANLTTGIGNTGVGYQAGQNVLTGGATTFVGYEAGQFASSSAYDIGIGYQALQSDANKGGNGNGANTAIGFRTMQNNQDGYFNAAIGYAALGNNTRGAANVGIGYNSLFTNTNGNNNTGIGYYSLEGLNGGSNNIGVGSVSGNNLTTGSNNIIIGYNINFPSATASNQLDIGNILYGTNVNGSLSGISAGNIGIASTSPHAKFSIQANNGETNANLFEIGSSTSSATTTLFSINNVGSTTAANGFNITAGCYAVNGTCIGSSGGTGTVTSIATNNGITGGTITTTGTIGLAAIAANSVLANITGGSAVPTALATSSLFQNASASITGLLSSTDWSTFNGKQAAGNYITALTGDVTAAGPGSVAATLATVNSNVGTFTYPSVTVNGKGLVTAISNGVAPATLITAGVGISTTTSSGGAILVSNTGVTSISGTTNQITASASTGAVTLSLPNLVVFPGTASTTGFTDSGIEWLTALGTPAGAFLAVDPNGKIIATTTPSGGGVTSVSNADGTLTISPTTGSVVASIALSHANTWTGLQQFNGNASTTQLTSTGSAYLATASGMVGVGTTSPSKIFTVEGNQSGGVARIQRDFPSAPASSKIGTYDVSLNETVTGSLADRTGPAQTFGVMNNGGAENIYADLAAVREGSDTNGALALDTYNAGVAATGIWITSTQMVGIATSSAWANLTVAMSSTTPSFAVGAAGSSTPAFIVASANANGNVGIGSSTPGSLLSIGNTGGINFNPTATSTFSSSANGINITNGCYAVGGVCIGGGSNYFTNSGIYTSLSTGTNLGVGTTSPFAQLSVLNITPATNPLAIYAQGITASSTTYTTTGTYVPPTGTFSVKAVAVGAGGGGGDGGGTNGKATGGGGGSSGLGSLVCAPGGGGGGTNSTGGTGGSTSGGGNGGAGGGSGAGFAGGGGAQSTGQVPVAMVGGSITVSVGTGGTGANGNTGTGGTAGTGLFNGANGGFFNVAGGGGGGCTGSASAGTGGTGGTIGAPVNGGTGVNPTGGASGSGAAGGGANTNGSNYGGGGGAGNNGAGAGAGAPGEVIVTSYIYTNASATPLLLAITNGGFGVDIGTTTASNLFTAQSPIQQTNYLFYGIVGAYTGLLDELDKYAHIISGGPAPTVGTCASVAGDDRNMRVITGSSQSTCTVNFANTYTMTPICVATEESGGLVTADASSTPTGIVLTFGTALTSKSIGVHCEISNNFTY